MELESEKNGLKNLNVSHYFRNVLKHEERVNPVFLIICKSLEEYKNHILPLLETNYKTYILNNNEKMERPFKSNIIFFAKDVMDDYELDRLYQEIDYVFYSGSMLDIIPIVLSGVTHIEKYKDLNYIFANGKCQDKYDRLENFEKAKKILDNIK